MEYFEILCGIAVILLLLYYYFTATFDFWKSRGVRGPRPIPTVGNVAPIMFGKLSVGRFLKKTYDEFPDEPLIGIFARRTPILIVKDPDLIKAVLIKDFGSFANRGLPVREKKEPLTQHLFALEYDRWRPLRTKLTPVFTSGKLKGMFKLILQCSDQLEVYLKNLVEKGEPIECRELTGKYTMDVIGSCAFGIETKSLTEQNSEFHRIGRRIFEVTTKGILRFRLSQSAPWLYRLLEPLLAETEVSDFITKMVKDTIDYRKEHNIVRNDFIDTLIDLKDHPEKISIQLTDGLLAAQAFVFFAAGFETSSLTISHALYELALNQAIQEKLRKEIRDVCKACDGDLTFEVITQMSYLDKVFQETLRKYPPGGTLLRETTEPYTFEGINVTIPKGTSVWIPVYGLHCDPKIYPKPDEFDPERFSEEVASTRHSMVFLPFGDGPRNCIGARFAIYQTKIGLFKIVRDYKVDVCEKTLLPYVHNPRSFTAAPLGGIYLKFTKVEEN